MTHFFLGQAHAELCRYDDAMDAVRKAIQLSGGSAEMTATLGYVYARSGDRARAKAVLEELKGLSKQRYVSPCLLAQVYAGLVQAEEALDCLNKAYEARATDLAWLRVRPMFDYLRQEPRFTALLEKIGLGGSDRTPPSTAK